MADTKNQPVEEPEEDSELSELRQSISFDETSYRSLLKEQGLPDAMIDLLVAPVKRQAEANAKVLTRQANRDLADYKSKLGSEFPLADPDLIQGTTKREMRAAAEKLQKFGERVLAAAGKAPAAPAAADGTTTTPATPANARAEAWGTPPASATTTITQAPVVPWEDLRAKAGNVLKPQGKAEILAEIKANGPKQSERQSMSSIVARNAPAPKA